MNGAKQEAEVRMMLKYGEARFGVGYVAEGLADHAATLLQKSGRFRGDFPIGRIDFGETEKNVRCIRIWPAAIMPLLGQEPLHMFEAPPEGLALGVWETNARMGIAQAFDGDAVVLYSHGPTLVVGFPVLKE